MKSGVFDVALDLMGWQLWNVVSLCQVFEDKECGTHSFIPFFLLVLWIKPRGALNTEPFKIWDRVSLVAQTGFELSLAILIFLSSWGYRCVPWCPALFEEFLWNTSVPGTKCGGWFKISLPYCREEQGKRSVKMCDKRLELFLVMKAADPTSY